MKSASHWIALLIVVAVAGRVLAQEEDVDPVPDVVPDVVPDAGVAADATPDAQPAPAEAMPEPPPPVKGTTGVRGTITDADTGAPIADVQVEVVKGGEGKTVTDADGNYRLDLEPGKYELRVTGDLYGGRRVRGVIVGRKPLELNVKLEPAPQAMVEIIVEGRADQRTESAGLEKRKKSAKVEDTISAQEIGRSPDSSAGDAVKRVVSATVIGGRYVFVRGLGGRYTSTLLNGVVVPSPDPDSSAVPLDMFPASLLANLTVVKKYTHDLPGAFSGGDLLITTNSYPDKLEVKLKVASAWDSETTFKDRNSYAGGSYDWLGFDSGARALPQSAPDDRPLRVGEPGIDAATAERIGEDFNDNWNLERTSSAPSLSLGAQAGNTEKLGGKKLGWLVTLGYGKKESLQQGSVASVRLTDDGGLGTRETLDSDIGISSVTWGGLVNVGLESGENHSLRLFSLYTRSADDRAQSVTGFSESDNQNIEARRLQFVTRALSFTQLTGEHRFPSAHGLELDWQANFSITTRYEPDTRDMKFNLLDDGRRRFVNGPGSAEHFFGELVDYAGGAGTTLSLPVADMTLSLGGQVQASDRSFDARRFRFSLIGQDPDVVFLDPELMLSADNIGPSFRVEERTLQADTYAASSSLLSGFFMADIARFAPLRIVGGVRYEVAAQTLTPGSPFAITDTPEPGIDRTDTHVMPAVNLVYSVTPAMNLRAGYSYTVARPQLRELAPFLYFDFARRRAVSGNPLLDDTRIQNADLRWEWFPEERSVLAASVFYKGFIDPIESVIVNVAQGDVSYANADGADDVGLELEVRGSFASLWPALEGFRGAANLTVISSNVDLGMEQGAQTSKNRPLQGQSPYVANIDLGWSSDELGTEVSVLYNVAGKRIAEVGIEGLPDTYEQPFSRVDLAASQKLGNGLRLKVAGTNLLGQSVVVKQGDIVIQKYQPGVIALVTLEWAP